MSRVVFDIPPDEARRLTFRGRTGGFTELHLPGLPGLVTHEPHLRSGDEIVLRCPELRVMIPAVITALDVPGRVLVAEARPASGEEPEVITFTSAAVMIGAHSALASGQAIGEVFDLTLWPHASSRYLAEKAVPGAQAVITVDRRKFEGRVVIADPNALVIQVEAEES